MDSIIKARALKEELDSLRPISSEQEQRIMQKFRLDWNYHSNNLEGNSLTYGETKALILFNITAQGKPLKDHFEITGHNEALLWIEEVVKDKRSLTQNFIRELHQLLLKEPYEIDAITPDGQPTKKTVHVGQYKTTPNHVKTVTGEIFRFATPEETPALMTDLLDWYDEKKQEENVDPVLLAAEFHYKFIRIHPFDDGNGRAARILMNFILMQFGYPPVIIKTEDKQNYISVLQQADAGILEPFVDYIAINLNRSLEKMIKGAKGESVEEADDIDKEISLLDVKLRNAGKKIEKIKSAETLKEFYEKTMVKLIEAFVEASSSFDKYFFEKIFITKASIGNGKTNDLKVLHQTIADFIKYENILFITLIIEQIKLNYTNFENFDAYYEIGFFFHRSTVNITCFNFQKTILYTEKLSEADINALRKEIKLQVKNMIEEAIKQNK
ncbi:MAG: Fic family protein [Parafilimonas sp.]